MSKAEALRLAKARWGKKVFARENRHAVNAAERSRMNERKQVLIRERDEANEELTALRKRIGNHWDQLLKAADFVCDVNGDSPSIDQLREAVAVSHRIVELTERYRELKEEIPRLTPHSRRCEIVEDNTWCTTWLAGADTWAELCEELKAKAPDPLTPTR